MHCRLSLRPAPSWTGVVAALLLSAPLLAGPMNFEDSTTAMGDFGPNWRDAWVNRACTARDRFAFVLPWWGSA